jgi:hypothetical protein
MRPEVAEIDRLRKEVAKLKMERDILKNGHRGAVPSQWTETLGCLH